MSIAFSTNTLKPGGFSNKSKPAESDQLRHLPLSKMNGLKQRIMRQGIAVEVVVPEHHETSLAFMQANRREIALCLTRLKRLQLNTSDYRAKSKASEIFQVLIRNLNLTSEAAEVLIEEAEKPRKSLLAAIGAIINQMMDEHSPPKLPEKLERKGKFRFTTETKELQQLLEQLSGGANFFVRQASKISDFGVLNCKKPV